MARSIRSSVKFAVPAVVALAIAIGSASPAHAGFHWFGDRDRGCSVPEIDPGVAGGAIAIVLGGVAALTGRRRRRD